MYLSPLERRIRDAILNSEAEGWYEDANGARKLTSCISFRDYMNDCLYDEQYGYYRSGPIRIGKEGDFYTSSAIGGVAARALAVHIADYVRNINEPVRLIEWGAGTGRLSAQLAGIGRELMTDWDDLTELTLVDDNPSHRQAARDALAAASVPLNEASVISSDQAWAADWRSRPVIVIANELLDAFPVHRIKRVDGELWELGVGLDGKSDFCYVHMKPTDERISEALLRSATKLTNGQITEINADGAKWLEKLGGIMAKGRLVLIDYGHEDAEYTARHRMEGTLMCYYRHLASDDPFLRPGEQDITAHLNFTHVRQAAERSGWSVSYFASQKRFLIDNGIFSLLRPYDGKDPFGPEARLNRAVRQLLLSDQMSETFKVMTLDRPR